MTLPVLVKEFLAENGSDGGRAKMELGFVVIHHPVKPLVGRVNIFQLSRPTIFYDGFDNGRNKTRTTSPTSHADNYVFLTISHTTV